MLTVYRTKKCAAVIESPKHGDTGFMKHDDGTLELVFFDKGGMERRPRCDGGDFAEAAPGWVNREEHVRRKTARSRYWKKVEGPKEFWESRRLSRSREGRFESMFPYGGEHPHAFC